MRLHNKEILGILYGVLLAAALPGIAYGGSDPHQMPEGGSMMGPATIPDLSLPLDCKTIDHEMSLLDKFSHNPKATPTQLAANAKRAQRLEAKRKTMNCPSA